MDSVGLHRIVAKNRMKNESVQPKILIFESDYSKAFLLGDFRKEKTCPAFTRNRVKAISKGERSCKDVCLNSFA